ncbi:6'''-hydroxyparomomycin C oxidase [bacterium BMS3Bbin02]|nr:6'''-hydroxyparomomycin C oxidase [bacterium BMS3Bbin02]
MLLDARAAPNGGEIEADICIIGGGMAGITIAREFIGTNTTVVVLESGQVEETDAAQELTAGTNVGGKYFDLTTTRFRVLGGSSQRWAGWCRPIDPMDFEERPWVQNSGWPISFDDLAPYFSRAHEVCQIENPSYDSTTPDGGVPPLYQPPFVNDKVATVTWTHSPPTKFGAVYRDSLDAAKNITVYLGATVTNLDGSTEHHVPSVTVHTDESTFTVTAKIFVLTLGGLETPRLLLTSTDAVPAGYGNQNDVVGRYFMDHPHLLSGHVQINRSHTHRPVVASLDRGVRGIRQRLALQRPASDRKFALSVSPEIQRSENLLNASIHFTVIHHAKGESDAVRSLRLVVGNLRSPTRMIRQIRIGAIPGGLGIHIRNILKGIPEVTRLVINNVVRKPRRLGLFAQAEQSPNPDSRVTVDPSDPDRYNVPRVVLNWQLTDQDKDSINRTQQLLSDHLVAVGIGRVEPEPWIASDNWGANLEGGHHHMGTARMGTDPSVSVVDQNGRIHGSDNVYIGDSSVFPTGGFSNPGLTMVAMALRLADHLKTL